MASSPEVPALSRFLLPLLFWYGIVLVKNNSTNELHCGSERAMKETGTDD